MWLNRVSDVAVESSSFQGNTATSGSAGLEMNQVQGSVNDCVFKGNKVHDTFPWRIC